MSKRYSASDAKATIRIPAGGDFDEWFEVVTRPTTGAIMDASNAKTTGERGIRMMLACVKAWSLVSDDGQPLPLTAESVRGLPMEMLKPLAEHIAEVTRFLQRGRT